MVDLEKESSSLSFSLFSLLNPERFSSTVKNLDCSKLLNYFWPIFKFWPISNLLQTSSKFPRFFSLNFRDVTPSPEMLDELKMVFAEVLTLNLSQVQQSCEYSCFSLKRSITVSLWVFLTYSLPKIYKLNLEVSELS